MAVCIALVNIGSSSAENDILYWFQCYFDMFHIYHRFGVIDTLQMPVT